MAYANGRRRGPGGQRARVFDAVEVWTVCVASRGGVWGKGMSVLNLAELFVESTVNLKGSAIVQLILDHGKLRPRDVISRLSNDDAKGNTFRLDLCYNLTRSPASAVYYQVLYRLVTQSYLKPSTVLSHISPRDKTIQFEKEEKTKLSGFPTAKELRYAKEAARARLKREEEEAEKVGLVS